MRNLIWEKCQTRFKLKLRTLTLGKLTFGPVINSKINLWWWEMLFKLMRIENSKNLIQQRIHSMKNKSQSYSVKLSTCLKASRILWITLERFQSSLQIIKFTVNWPSTSFHVKKMVMKVSMKIKSPIILKIWLVKALISKLRSITSLTYPKTSAVTFSANTNTTSVDKSSELQCLKARTSHLNSTILTSIMLIA